MTPITSCPTPDQLREYSLGKAPDEEFDAVERHLESCGACQAVLESHDGLADSVVEGLRKKADETTFSSEKACIDLVAEAAGLFGDTVLNHAPAASTKEDLKRAGKTIGQYEILARIGQGGMGAVYKARHTKLNRIVALKEVACERSGDQRSTTRFEREMRAVARLDHPNIVRAYDAGEGDGRLFFVMEYIDGVDTGKLIERLGPLDAADACEIARQAAVGLACVHEHGLVHRDVKPSNLMVTASVSSHAMRRTPLIKMLDLGLARDLDAEADHPEDPVTSTGTVMGTFDYLAPEQVDDSHGVDIRADLYGLGCTLYALLAGRPPFAGEEFARRFQKLRAHAEVEPTPITTIRSDVPAELSALVGRLLAKRREDRFQTPAEAVHALEPFARGSDLAALLQRYREAGESKPLIVEVGAGPSAPVSSSSATGDARAADRLPTVEAPRANRRAGWFLALGLLFLASTTLVLQIVIRVRNQDGSETRIVTPAPAKVSLEKDGKVIASIKNGIVEPAADPPRETNIDRTLRAETNVSPSETTPLPSMLGEKAGRERDDNGLALKLVLCPPGKFKMGDPPNQVEVTLTKGFWIGKTEVTQQQWRSVMLTEPWKAREKTKEGADFPVTWVSWFDAVDFCHRLTLSEQESGRLPTGWEYRLPTETEWEFACRAGTTSRWHFNEAEHRLGSYAWYQVNSSDAKENYAHQVGSKRANAWGLHDMYGNVWEWCLDQWSQDPQGGVNPRVLYSAADSNSVVRGGSWISVGDVCRSAERGRFAPGFRDSRTGFRLAFVESSAATPHETIAGKPIGEQNAHMGPKARPVDPQFVNAVGELPPKDQAEAVRKRLVELNPKFDGKLDLKIEHEKVVELSIVTDQVTDISPIAALAHLRQLVCAGSGFDERKGGTGRLADLSPLQGMRLKALNCRWTQVADLSALKGMPLDQLSCPGTRVFDLSPLAGMPLTYLALNNNARVVDLAPLKGMPLAYLNVGWTSVADLSPIKDARLTNLTCASTRVKDLAPVAGMKLAFLDCHGTLIEDLSPLTGSPITQLNCSHTRVVDLSPLKGMPLTNLNCSDTRVFDLSPLESMPLNQLNCGVSLVFDLGPLNRSPLAVLEIPGTKVTNLAALKGLPLTRLNCAYTKVSDLSALAGMKLTAFNCEHTPVADLSPLKGLPLKTLYCFSTNVADLSPLRGLPLTYLQCADTPVSDLSPLHELPLDGLNCGSTRVTDLWPLKGLPLKALCCSRTQVADLEPLRDLELEELNADVGVFSPADEQIIKSLPLSRLSINNDIWSHGIDPSQAWANLAARREAILDFVARVSRLGLDAQIAAVSEKLAELNPNSRATLDARIENGAVAQASVDLKNAADISPLRALAKLRRLSLQGGPRWLDLSPINSLPLEELSCSLEQVQKNAPLLREMKSLRTINGKPAAISLSLAEN